ncbi:hypothetical protein Tco_0341715 [Tanacetum coccineum]
MKHLFALLHSPIPPPVKRKLAPGSSSSCVTHAKASSSKDDTPFIIVFDDDEGLPDVFKLKDANACHLKISAITSPAWKNHSDNHMDVELLDLHNRCYARQAFLDNAVNSRSRELLQVIEKIRGECDVMKEKERAQEEEYEELRSKCKVTMTDFEKNPTVVAMREKMSTLSTKAKEHKANLESKVASLEAKKARLEAVEASLKKGVDDVKHDRMEVVLKVVPYAALELIHSDELGRLFGKLVSSALLYGRCAAFEQVADMKEPFDLSKMKGYRPSYKKEHTQAGNDLATTTFSLLSEFVSDPSTPIEVLLSKKPSTLQRPVSSKTQVPAPSSQRATPSSAPASYIMSPPTAVSSVKSQSSQAFSFVELWLSLGTKLLVVGIMAFEPNLKPPEAIGRGPRMLTLQWLNGYTLPAAIALFPATFLAIDCSFAQFCITFAASMCIDGQ